MSLKNEGAIVTVNGPIDPARVTMALTHEHLLFSAVSWLADAEQPGAASAAFDPISPQNAAWLRHYPWASRDNLVQSDWRLAAKEIRRYKLAGGNMVVDASSVGIGRDVWGLRKIADDVGIHVVAGSGFYVDASHPWDMDARSVDEIAAEIAGDILHGADDTDICAGVIGEIGTSDPVTENEWKVVRAAAYAHQETGAVIQIHSAHELRVVPSVLDVLVGEGNVDPSRIIVCHVDMVHDDPDYTRRLADYGVFLEYDLFGHPCPFPDRNVSDEDRVAGVERLLESGYASQLLFSHDLGLQARLASFGGPGYEHIVRVALPWLRRRGATPEVLQQIVTENPRRAFALSHVAPAPSAAGRLSEKA